MVAYRRALPNVRDASQTLAEAMRIEIDSPSAASLYIPHYWAVYVNDGRGPVFPIIARFLIWFRDPANDPRLKGGYPERAADIRHMTKSEFRFWAAKNAEAGPGNEPMIVARVSRAVKPGKHFFDNFAGMAFLYLEINRELGPLVQADILASLDDILNMKWTTKITV